MVKLRDKKFISKEKYYSILKKKFENSLVELN